MCTSADPRSILLSSSTRGNSASERRLCAPQALWPLMKILMEPELVHTKAGLCGTLAPHPLVPEFITEVATGSRPCRPVIVFSERIDTLAELDGWN